MAEIEERGKLIVVRETPDEERGDRIDQPAKLLRIASMARHLLEEARQAPLDERGRERLREIYDASLRELKEVLSDDLQRELDALVPRLEEAPTDAEIRVAQAQLVGWLEGLFHGIQAALWAQQMQAQAQFEAMRRRALPQRAPQKEERKEQEPESFRYL
ncbi:MAG TPA: proteasome activator [Actinomycetota bacterium]|nr:proteasome activator [Actinomycetota bacterium]